MAAYWPISVLSVSEKLVCHSTIYGISFPLLSALLSGLLLQHTLHASVCFAGCKRSDPSVLAAGKWHSRTEILAFIGSTLTCLLTTPTKSHPHKFNLFFAIPSVLIKFAKVKFTQNIIALRYHFPLFSPHNI